MYRTPSPPPPPKRDFAKLALLIASGLFPVFMFGIFVWFVVGMCGR